MRALVCLWMQPAAFMPRGNTGIPRISIRVLATRRSQQFPEICSSGNWTLLVILSGLNGMVVIPENTLEMAGRMAEYGIVPEFSFVLGNPPDPEADARATLQLIRRVKRVNPLAEIILYLYTPVPLAGDLYDEAQAGGFAFPQTLDEWISPAWLDFSQRRSSALPWLPQPLHARLRDFERVLNAYYPTSTDPRLRGAGAAAARRWALRAAAAWRYHLQIYRFPLELRLLQHWVAYQRPETSGF